MKFCREMVTIKLITNFFQMSNNTEGVKIGNEGEVKWVGYLLQLDPVKLSEVLTTRQKVRIINQDANEILINNLFQENGEKTVPLNIDQALDLRCVPNVKLKPLD